jgi:hypothetical protein
MVCISGKLNYTNYYNACLNFFIVYKVDRYAWFVNKRDVLIFLSPVTLWYVVFMHRDTPCLST